MNKTEFVTKVQETHREYESIIAKLDAKQLLKPRACVEWSVKDVIAHVSWYEKQMVDVLKTRALVGSNLWNVSLEERNAAIFKENKNRPLPEVLSEAQEVFKELLRLIKNLTDDDLLHASHFREMPADWVPLEVIASNTFEHYPDHTKDILKAFPGR